MKDYITANQKDIPECCGSHMELHLRPIDPEDEEDKSPAYWRCHQCRKDVDTCPETNHVDSESLRKIYMQLIVTLHGALKARVEKIADTHRHLMMLKARRISTHLLGVGVVAMAVAIFTGHTDMGLLLMANACALSGILYLIVGFDEEEDQ